MTYIKTDIPIKSYLWVFIYIVQLKKSVCNSCTMEFSTVSCFMFVVRCDIQYNKLTNVGGMTESHRHRGSSMLILQYNYLLYIYTTSLNF